MQKSKEEFKKFKTTGQTVYLAQAGEKLWNAFNILIELKLKRKTKSFADLKKATGILYQKTWDTLWLDTFQHAYDLHRFFYRGWTDDEDEIVHLFQNTYTRLLVLEKMKV